MPVDEAHLKEIRTLVAAARQQPVNFGLCLGAKPETDTLLMHRSKAAKALSTEAKAQAKGTKFAFGIATAEGSTLSLACEEKPPSGLAKRARTMLKAMKLNMKVRLVGADGEIYEDDSEEEEAPAQAGADAGSGPAAAPEPAAAKPPEPPPAAPPPPASEAAPDTAALAKLLATLAARIPAAAGADEARRAALLKLATQANVYLKTNNPNYASSTIEQLRTEIEGGSPKPPAPPEAAPVPDAAALAKQLAALIPRVAALADPARKAELGKLAQMCNVYLKTSNWNTAASSIAELARALDGSSSGAPPRTREAGVFEKAGREWLAARQGVEDEMERLRATIMATYEGQPVSADIDKNYRERTAPVLRTLDASLAVKLSAASKAEPAAQQGLIDEASAIVRNYEAFAAGPLLADLDDNPFVPLSIQANLTATLSQISAAIR